MACADWPDQRHSFYHLGKAYILFSDRRSSFNSSRARYPNMGLWEPGKRKGAYHIWTLPLHQKSPLLREYDFGDQHSRCMSILGSAGNISGKFLDHLSGCGSSRKGENVQALSRKIPGIQQARTPLFPNAQAKASSRSRPSFQLGTLQAE